MQDKRNKGEGLFLLLAAVLRRCQEERATDSGEGAREKDDGHRCCSRVGSGAAAGVLAIRIKAMERCSEMDGWRWSGAAATMVPSTHFLSSLFFFVLSALFCFFYSLG